MQKQSVISSSSPHPKGIDCIKWKDNLVFSCGKDDRVMVTDPRSGTVVKEVGMQCAGSNCLTVSSTGSEIAVGHNQGFLSTWDFSSLKMIDTWQPHQDDCRSVDYSPDSQFLLTSSFDCSAKVTSQQQTVYSLDCHSDKVVMARFHP